MASRQAPGKPPAGLWIPLGLCDAAASGSEDAQVRLTRGMALLELCAHHATRHELALVAAGWQVSVDNRAWLR